MYSVLIAEDELLVRMGIASSVDWTQNDMSVVEEVADGLAAWRAFEEQKPDIIIADIRMPKVDGVELLHKIRMVDSTCAVIVITNVENDETLTEVRKLGVIDILIKASMRKNDIIEALNRAKASLEQNNRKGSSSIYDENAKWKIFFESDSSCDDNMDFQGMTAPNGYVLMRIVDNKGISKRLQQSLISLFIHRMHSFNNTSVSLEDENGVTTLFFQNWKTDSIMHTLNSINWYINDHFGESMLFVVKPFYGSLEQLTTSISVAKEYFCVEQIFHNGLLEIDENDNVINEQLEAVISEISRCKVFYESNAKVQNFISEIEKLPKEFSVSWENGKKHVYQILRSFNIDYMPLNIDDATEKLNEILKKEFSQTSCQMSSHIAEAVDYMNKHQSDKLSIQTLAQMIGYHPAYFSNLFKKETGIGFSDYLTKLRIIQAKKYLRETNLTLQEIATECGFQDLSYFCIKFKKIVHVTPTQWRLMK